MSGAGVRSGVMSHRTIRTAVAAAAIALTAAGCSSAPWEGTANDEPGYEACREVGVAVQDTGGAGIAVALPPAQRTSFVEAATQGGDSDADGMAGASAALVAAGDAPSAQWARALDEFSQVCADLDAQAG